MDAFPPIHFRDGGRWPICFPQRRPALLQFVSYLLSSPPHCTLLCFTYIIHVVAFRLYMYSWFTHCTSEYSIHAQVQEGGLGSTYISQYNMYCNVWYFKHFEFVIVLLFFLLWFCFALYYFVKSVCVCVCACLMSLCSNFRGLVAHSVELELVEKYMYDFHWLFLTFSCHSQTKPSKVWECGCG